MNNRREEGMRSTYKVDMTVEDFMREKMICEAHEDDKYYYFYVHDPERKARNSGKRICDSGAELFWIIEKKTGTCRRH